MLKRSVFIGLFVVLMAKLFASGENFVVGANQTAMGGVSATTQNVFSAHHNTAGLGFVQNYTFGFYANRPYITQAINEFNLCVALPFQKIGTFGIDINYFGYSAYNEMRTGIAYGRSFGKKVAVGLKFDYLRIGISGQKAKNTVAFGVGLQYQPIKVLRLGASVYNPVALVVDAQYKEKTTTQFNVGASYLPIKKLSLHIEVEKDLSNPMRFRAGIEYKPLKYLFLRTGVATSPTLFTFGVGTAFKNFGIDASATWHLRLGISPQISVYYQLNKKKKSESK